MHYLEWNPAGSKALVLLHGVTANAWWWEDFARHLPADYRLLALDQRGHGDSDWADDYSHERHCEDITGFIEQLGIDRTVMVGQSMGGLIPALRSKNVS